MLAPHERCRLFALLLGSTAENAVQYILLRRIVDRGITSPEHELLITVDQLVKTRTRHGRGQPVSATVDNAVQLPLVALAHAIGHTVAARANDL